MSRTPTIDWTRCDGHGLCAQLLPGTTLDEWSFPVLPPDGTVTEQDARAAVLACPALALRLERAQNKAS
ncbi:MAG: ferredoxin [Aeromicrobium erythreum]